MTTVNQQSLMAYRIFNGLAPMELSKGVTIDLDFTASGSNGLPIDIDLDLITSQGQISIVQGLFIDNFDSGQNFILTTQISGHRIAINSGRQGMWPLFVPPNATFQGTVAGVTVKNVRLIFTNIPLPAMVW